MVLLKDAVIAFLFIVFGVLGAITQRWQKTIEVIGNPKSRRHSFDHFFLLWFFQQVLQMCLLPWWFAIKKNWLGCSRFQHWEVKPRVRNNQNILGGFQGNVVQIDNDAQQQRIGNRIHEAGGDDIQEENDDDRAPLINERVGDGAVLPVDDNAGQAVNNDHPVINRGEDGDVVVEQLPNRPGRKKRKEHTKLTFLPPAIFGTVCILMTYFGSKLTLHSSFIMLKGSEALFTALLSIAFLAQNYMCYMWLGILLPIAGFAVSGISDYVQPPPNSGYEKYGIAAGDLLIVMSQITFASRVVYEERFIKKYSLHPMKFLGWEGVYGSVFSLIFLLIFNFLPAEQYSDPPSTTMEDVVEAFRQMSNSWEAVVASIVFCVATVLYYYFGMFMIRDHGALARIMMETLIWAAYWAACVALDWEQFYICQIPGLVAVPIGVLIYFRIVPIPFLRVPEVIRNNVDIYGQGPDRPYNAFPVDGGFHANGVVQIDHGAEDRAPPPGTDAHEFYNDHDDDENILAVPEEERDARNPPQNPNQRDRHDDSMLF